MSQSKRWKRWLRRSINQPLPAKLVPGVLIFSGYGNPRKTRVWQVVKLETVHWGGEYKEVAKVKVVFDFWHPNERPRTQIRYTSWWYEELNESHCVFYGLTLAEVKDRIESFNWFCTQCRRNPRTDPWFYNNLKYCRQCYRKIDKIYKGV